MHTNSKTNNAKNDTRTGTFPFKMFLNVPSNILEFSDDNHRNIESVLRQKNPNIWEMRNSC
jgi:hypothetical protein